jgi:exonuclease VII small subunit
MNHEFERDKKKLQDHIHDLEINLEKAHKRIEESLNHISSCEDSEKHYKLKLDESNKNLNEYLNSGHDTTKKVAEIHKTNELLQ